MATTSNIGTAAGHRKPNGAAWLQKAKKQRKEQRYAEELRMRCANNINRKPVSATGQTTVSADLQFRARRAASNVPGYLQRGNQEIANKDWIDQLRKMHETPQMVLLDVLNGTAIPSLPDKKGANAKRGEPANKRKRDDDEDAHTTPKRQRSNVHEGMATEGAVGGTQMGHDNHPKTHEAAAPEAAINEVSPCVSEESGQQQMPEMSLAAKRVLESITIRGRVHINLYTQMKGATGLLPLAAYFERGFPNVSPPYRRKVHVKKGRGGEPKQQSCRRDT